MSRLRSSRSVFPPILMLGALALLAGCLDESPLPTEPDRPPVDTKVDAPSPGPFVPGQVLVKLVPGSNRSAIAAAHGASVDREVIPGVFRLQLQEGLELATAKALSRNPNVVFAEPNWIRLFGDPLSVDALPTDPLFGYKWDLHNDGTINNPAGDEMATTGRVDADIDWAEMHDDLGSAFAGATVVGILDSGVRDTHEDFCGRVVAKRDFMGSGTGADDNGHGTHVTGIATGCADNGAGVAGVAYGRNVKVVMAKVCGPYFFGLLYGCTSEAISAGIYWAVDEQGAKVLNLSLGGGTPSETERLALAHALSAGALPVCAAGNDSGGVSYPGAFDECMAVSATDWGDDLASYSNFGPQVEVAAPGGDSEDPALLSAIASSCYGSDSDYCLKGGTSMAAPQVTGLAAMLFALGATSPEQVRALIRSTADDLGAPGFDDRFGDGRINAAAAVAELTGGEPPPPPDPIPPTAEFTWECSGLACSFTDASSDDPAGGLVAWSWDFGDGNGSNEQNPSHTFASAGTRTVTLQVTDGDGLTDDVAHDVTVIDAPPAPIPPTAEFSWECTGLTCSFTDSSSDDPAGGLIAWSWDFGDGATSTEQNPTHTYAATGTWTVVLEVTDSDDLTDQVSHGVEVTQPSGPTVMYVADIDASPQKGPRGTWRPSVLVQIRDTNGDPVQGAIVSGMFGGALVEPDQGTTGADGWTRISSDATVKGKVSVSYEVMAVFLDLATPYDSSLNTDPDGDSDGTRIVFTR
ncbi:MAG: S8 family serine peptidase [marine benthic group bacterium]|nr:S8 family serine peptidase [Gemmatimonadota bacterium]MCL7973896.1 S8 family serine peptidase [Gemmatimonadota bacterium]MCL7982533.1 S8 family serine peptidase [Gemmatimonadota bacterium]MCL7990835.1 S8 family serine peptidase [Gemmatimonadota bacterium]